MRRTSIKSKKNARRCGKNITVIKGIRVFERYYKGRLCYAIEKIDSGYTAVFNHRKYILQDIIAKLNANYRIYVSVSSNNLLWCENSKQYTPFAKYLYYLYHSDISDNTAPNNNILHLRKREYANIEDCRKENLCVGGATVFRDENEKRVVIKTNTDNICDFFDLKQVLADILQSRNIVKQRGKDGRLDCYIKSVFSFSVADLAYLAYYDTSLTADNYIQKLNEFKVYKKEHRYNIEHLDGDYTNHHKYNIALVSEKLNSRKNDKISRIVEPYFFTAVTDGKNFKILIGYFDEDLMIDVEKRFITDNFENVVALLDIYSAEYPERVDKKKAVAKNKKLIQKRFFAEMLAKEPDEHFVSLDSLGGERRERIKASRHKQ